MKMKMGTVRTVLLILSRMKHLLHVISKERLGTLSLVQYLHLMRSAELILVGCFFQHLEKFTRYLTSKMKKWTLFFGRMLCNKSEKEF